MSARDKRSLATARRVHAPVFAALGDETRLSLVAKLCEASPQSIAQATYRLVRGAEASPWQPGKVDSAEVAEFRGPF